MSLQVKYKVIIIHLHELTIHRKRRVFGKVMPDICTRINQNTIKKGNYYGITNY